MNWNDVASGFAIGTLVSAIYFAGLALSVRIALGGSKAGLVLLISAALRILVFLLATWAIVQMGVSSALGFAAAFLAVRFAAVMIARVSSPNEVR